MVSPAPARAGDEIGSIDTPALIVDLDALDFNIDAMAKHVRVSNMMLRPHAKTHKSVEIARRQFAAGAIGLCCQKVSEAEALLPSGVSDMLVSNHIVGAAKLDKLAELARKVRITTLTSDTAHVTELADAARRNGVIFEILIELDAGDARMGLGDESQLLPLAEAIAASPHLKLRGLQVYNGPFQHLRPQTERAAAAKEAGQRALCARIVLESAGLPCDLISGGGTGTYAEDTSVGAFTELQPGSYVFMDGDYARNFSADGSSYRPFRQSLFVLTRVLRAAAPDVVYVDAGVKALNLDSGMPTLHERPDLVFTKASDEQGRIETLPGGKTPALGELLHIVPSHCDPTVNQFDWMVAVRGGRVTDVWPVDARGCVL
ncbi:alanine racemase [Terrihabitans soli]|uniref:Alanine racemase n=1 Tax=Terrihabitans soli TaxID=708113 RepID=A0A6S6QT88_9HYPH|nr:DSD1 family PLP-dependent enzyme [Terrihabitans soli]BCJ89658.1 alanine racemase [Terrihabitans soli]